MAFLVFLLWNGVILLEQFWANTDILILHTSKGVLSWERNTKFA